MTVTPHLVALDVDGTTITHAGEMSPVVRDAVRAVADAGHHVTIATGRSRIVSPFTRLMPSLRLMRSAGRSRMVRAT